MKPIKIWPHLTLVAILCAVLGGAAAALWVRYEQTAEAQALPGAARIERVDGQVGLNHSLDTDGSNTRWDEATSNTPVSVGDRIYTRDNSRAAIAFTGRNFARLNAGSSLDVLTLSDQRTQLALRDGSALFDVGSLESGQLFEVATPCGAVDLNQPGLYQVAIDDNGSAIATVLSGLAQVVGQGGTGRIERGEVLTVPCQAASQAVVSRVEPRYAGTLIDDYYTYRYPRLYDHRYRDYNTYLNDPYYYDPYRRYVSYQYVTDVIPGIYDLDYYGDWQDVSGYGYCWHPRVDAGWAPYQSGYWITDYPYGLTWISNEPWGYAPYHYGRWSYFSNQWFWVPERAGTRPLYSPALVAFVPVTQTNQIGWVPLGPGDPYALRYYGPNWEPHYLNRTRVVEERIVNLNVPGAVTVVQAEDFNRVIDRKIITRVDRQTLDHARPVLDPFTVDSLRQTALRTREARQRIDVPQDVAQRIFNTRVVTSAAPVVPPFGKDLTRELRAESIPERARNQKLQFKDDRQNAGSQVSEQARQPIAGQAGQSSTIATDQGRERQMAALAAEAARGNREARRQMQQLEREQRQQQLQQQRADRTRAQEAQGQRVGQPAQQQAQREQIEAARQQQQAQKKAARQQAIAARQQRRNAAQQQVESRRQQTEAQRNIRRQANQQAEIQPTQQEAARRAQQRQARPQPPLQPREQRPQARHQQPKVQQQVLQQKRQQATQQQAQRQILPQQIRQQREQRPQVQMRQQQPRPRQSTEHRQALPQEQKSQPASAQSATPQPQPDRARGKGRERP